MNKNQKSEEKKPIKKTSSKSKDIKKPKIDYKKEHLKAKQRIIDLEKKIIEKELENNTNIEAFQKKAQGFQEKAQQEINKIKQELHKSLESEKLNIQKFGSQKLIESLIEPLINFELAINAGKNNEAVKAYVMGFEMLMQQLYAELSTHGVIRIDPKIGETFNPELHYAIIANKGKRKNKIVEVKKPGFKLHDRVIKPATVVIEK